MTNGDAQVVERMPRVAEDVEDAVLVRAVAGGSAEALGVLFRRHSASVHRIAFGVTGTAQDAEDVLQDVFVGLRRALDRYEERGHFGSWLRTVAARTALMRVRARDRHPVVALGALQIPTPAPSGGGVVDRLVVRDALEAMPDGLRRVFLLKEVEGYTHDEIASLLDISVAASRVRLHRAWRFLDARMGGDA